MPVRFINGDIAPGIKKGGALNVVRHAIALKVPADDIPDSITADLGELDIGDSLHVSALTMPEGCKPVVTDRDFTIATVAPPIAAPDEPAAPAAAAPAAAAPAAAAKPAKKK